jgi:hypothetical protein
MDRHEQVARVFFKDAPDVYEGSIHRMAALLREHFPEPKGRCGECGHRKDPSPEPVNGTQMWCGYFGSRVPIICYGCPRWKPREDRAARLAREWFSRGGVNRGRVFDTNAEAVKALADFLRANGVEGE